ncbi:MAG: hydrogenase maturation protease [Anaerolineae bacterium]
MYTIVIGIGNPWASDDGVGVEVVRRLQARLDAEPQQRRPPVRLLARTQPDLDLLEELAGCRRLVVVDAVASGAPPGSLHHLVWQPDRVAGRGLERASSHGFGLGDWLLMADALGRLPSEVEVWGIEVARTEPGPGLSPAVAAALPGLVNTLRASLSP